MFYMMAPQPYLREVSTPSVDRSLIGAIVGVSLTLGPMIALGRVLWGHPWILGGLALMAGLVVGVPIAFCAVLKAILLTRQEEERFGE
jgi:hypothetical protein